MLIENVEYDVLLERFKKIYDKVVLNIPNKEKSYSKPYIIVIHIILLKVYIWRLNKQNRI